MQDRYEVQITGLQPFTWTRRDGRPTVANLQKMLRRFSEQMIRPLAGRIIDHANDRKVIAEASL